MFTATRLLLAALCATVTAVSSLAAQSRTYEVNFASITFVNLQLDEDCARDVIYMNLLTGDPDADGDGIVPPQEAFIIEIEDQNPANGRTVDGCGMFDYTIEPHPDSMVVGFTFGSGTITARDATPPAVFGPPAAPLDRMFFTTQLQELTVNTLPSNVPRSFVVESETTFPDMGTMPGALASRLLAGGTIPRFTDGCSDINVTVEDVITAGDECDDIVITRIFRATDNSTVCGANDNGPAPSSGETTVSYDIVLERPDAADVMPPAELVTYECNELPPGVTLPDPDPEDYPFLEGATNERIFLNEVFGNVAASFTNSAPVQTCDNTIKFVRTYTVIDWCNTDNVRTFSQLVKVGDTNPPTLTINNPAGGPVVFSTNAPGCGAFINTMFAGLQITDGCSAVTTLETFVLIDGDDDNVVGPINPNAPSPVNRLTPFLPAGPHTLQYVATDECGNQGTFDIDILIVDQASPVLVLEDALNVALSSAGFAVVAAEDLDIGSYDDCSDVTLEIAFANPNNLLAIGDFGPTITLTCLDLTPDGTGIPVIVRGTDALGNVSTGMSIINLIDNTAPICVAPANQTIDCETADGMLPEDVNDFVTTDPVAAVGMFNELFGAPTSVDNCGDELASQLILSTVNDCGTGAITRTFTVTDGQGFSSAPGCEQIITIAGVRDYTVEFPGDSETTCGMEPTFDDFAYTPMGCDMVVSHVEVDSFFASSDACFKLRRTIEIINWCEYDGSSDFYTVRRDADNDGNFEEATFLHVTDGDGGQDVAILDRDGDRDNNNNIRFLDPDDAFGGTDSDNDGDTGYANSASRGAFRYVQFIKVYDNNAPVITNIDSEVTNNQNCDGGSIMINYELQDDCRSTDLTSTVELDIDFVPGGGFTTTRNLSGNELVRTGNGTYTVNLPGLPAGQHAIRVRATDGCANVAGRIINFDIQDNSVVTPICAGQLTFFLNADGSGGGIASVRASDYIISTDGNCGEQEVKFAVFTEAEYSAPGFVPNNARESYTVTCADLGTTPVRIYAFLPGGNFQFCAATATVQESNAVTCNDANLASLAGFIVSPANDLLDGIEVHISDLNGMAEMQYTDENGSFLFPALSAGEEYMIRPDMPDEVNTRRVKTSDINVIARHALGDEPITHPHRMIAADVHTDSYIDVFDMIAIRRVILGLDETYALSPTWRFIQRDFDLEGLEEGWDYGIFPTTFTVEELEGHNRDADFVAIEIGDVFVQANGREALALTATDATLAAGQRHRLTLTAPGLTAFQGTLRAAAGLSIVGWSSTTLTAGNVNDSDLDRGLLAFAFQTTTAPASAPEITLDLIAYEDLRLSEYLRVTDDITVPEAMRAADASATLELDFTDAPGGDEIILHQNFPNPAASYTNIVFELPRAGEVELSVHDLSGRLVTHRRLAGVAGRNRVALSTYDDLNNKTGVLSYTITVGQTRLTKRMTVVRR